MSARQEKVREALGAAKSLAARAPYCGYRADYFDAALAEVEETEARLAELERLCEQANEDFHRAHDDRFAAEAEAAEWKGHARRYKGELATAQAEADRLKAALEQIVACDYRGNMPYEQAIARAALAPADRNTA